MPYLLQHWKFPNRCTVTPELVGVNDFWRGVLTKEPSEEHTGRLRVPVRLKQDVEHRPVLIHRTPQPMFGSSDRHAHFVEIPARTSTGFALPQFFREQRRELDVPLPHGLETDHDAALMEEFLDIPLAQRETVVQPQGVADDAQGKTVAVRLPTRHNSAAYPV